MDYEDFEIEVGLRQGKEYPVVIRSPGGEVRATMAFPFDKQTLENHLLKLQNTLLRSGGTYRRVLTPEARNVQEFGQSLFDALIADETRNCYDVSRDRASQKDKGLRLKLRIVPPEMTVIPWEFLFDHRHNDYIVLSKRTPIIRYLELPRPPQALIASLPLRILAMISTPEDYPVLDIEKEKQKIVTALSNLDHRKLVELVWLEGQTWSNLQQAMLCGPWHIFHFIGHGGFDPDGDEGVIVFADEQNRSNSLNATHLARLLDDHHLRLVVLNSCEGARGSEHDIFSSTASILVRRGIPAVLAMQYAITDQAAIEFARSFYGLSRL